MQVNKLMDQLESGKCVFIRCLKPNEHKKPEIWNSSLVLNQIRYLGLLDSISIRKESYPHRHHFKDFCAKYLELEPTLSHLMPDQLEANGHSYESVTRSILNRVLGDFGEDQLLVGRSKVFMKIKCDAYLKEAYHKACEAKVEAIKNIEIVVKNVAYKQILERFRKQSLIAVSVAEQLIEGFQSKLEYRKFRFLRRAVITIQNRFRYKKI